MPRAGLTAAAVIAQAARIADQVGLDRLTLAAVAKECGVSLPGLYKHIEGLDAVRRGIAVLAVGELTQALAAATSGLSGRDALAALARAYRHYADAHPGRYQASVRAPAPGDAEHAQASTRAIGVLQAALREYGMAGENLVHAVRMVRITCHGLASLDAAGGFALAESLDATFDHLVNALDTEFRAAARWAARPVA